MHYLNNISIILSSIFIMNIVSKIYNIPFIKYIIDSYNNASQLDILDISSCDNLIYDNSINIHPLKKIKSSIFLNHDKNNIDTIYSINMTNNYSNTFDYLKKIIPSNTKAMEFLDELIKNKSTDNCACCNPDCREILNLQWHLAFDGYYCSIVCRTLAVQHIQQYWNQIYK